MKEFYRRLQVAEPAHNLEEARRLIDRTLNDVEDELSGIPNDPAHWQTDGRMYPVQDDRAADVDGRPDLTSYRSRSHETLIAENGAFIIRNVRTEEIELDKPGADGRGVSP